MNRYVVTNMPANEDALQQMFDNNFRQKFHAYDKSLVADLGLDAKSGLLLIAGIINR